ncbi:ribonuclease P protein component [Flectobacillus major]|jgi:ribonuclease P protein component|uniref:ribonuclease P protein component n=1 Tax=Flectobacillus major TaxID=103 RepID=UPI00040FE6CB|nr:ribonuclease P protein component [Flectobacillus major]
MKKTFKKSERLSSKKIIESLFDKGSEQTKSVFLYPFRVSFLEKNTDTPSTELPQILISVSKRYFKHAVDRNLIKRRTREAYRLNKQLLLQKNTQPLPAYIAFVYIAKKIEDYAKIEKAMKGILYKMN